MAEKKLYIGDIGPLLFDDDDDIDDPDGDFSGEKQLGVRTGAPIRTDGLIKAAAIEATIEVADISSPTELGGFDASNLGTIVMVFEDNPGTPDKFTLYAWDDDSGSANSPYVVAGSTGYWVAIGGKYINDPSIGWSGSQHDHSSAAEGGTLDHSDLTNDGSATGHVTNGDSHDHSGGDGAQIDHTGLNNKGTNTHAQIDTHIAATNNPHSVELADVLTQQSHINDAETVHVVTDPADAPADADALRDDLVANVIPDIEGDLDALGTKINTILTALESAGILATS